MGLWFDGRRLDQFGVGECVNRVGVLNSWAFEIILAFLYYLFERISQQSG